MLLFVPFIEAIGEHHAVSPAKLVRNIGFSATVSNRTLFCGRIRALVQPSGTKPHCRDVREELRGYSVVIGLEFFLTLDRACRC